MHGIGCASTPDAVGSRNNTPPDHPDASQQEHERTFPNEGGSCSFPSWLRHLPGHGVVGSWHSPHLYRVRQWARCSRKGNLSYWFYPQVGSNGACRGLDGAQSDDVFGMLATPLLDVGVGGLPFQLICLSYKSQSADSLCAWVRGKRQSSLHVGHGQHRYEAGIATRVTMLICNGPGVEGSLRGEWGGRMIKLLGNNMFTRWGH